ncbi:MAG TPA: glycine betaine ABC transporter substrate-binding protein [Roseiflexaceae bacterium]|nr:glycine betaine ABC transporter substrate-binding protein [Roseiflexaceae bacterium]
MQPSFRFPRLLLLALLTLVLVACGAPGIAPAPTAAPLPSPTVVVKGPIRVGSKNFTEQFIVAEMYAQLLANAGFTVEKKLNLGDTAMAHAALTGDTIDMYPEYTSTGLQAVLNNTTRFTDARQIYNTVKQGYAEKFSLIWLEPAPFNDTTTFVTTSEIANRYALKTFSDLAKQASELRLGGPPEFPGRQDNQAVDKLYGGFIGSFKEFKPLGSGVQRYDALRRGDVDVVVGFGTDGRIKADRLVVLEDDKTGYPIYNIAPVVRANVLQQYPEIADILNRLAPLLTDDVMAGLNYQVDGPDLEQPSEVARAFLEQQGLFRK